jgi:hypothetical protein
MDVYFVKNKILSYRIIIFNVFINSCETENIKTSVIMDKDKKILDKIINRNISYQEHEGVYKDGELYAFQHGFSLIDNWSGLVYDIAL